MQIVNHRVTVQEARVASRNVGSVITWCPSGNLHEDDAYVHEQGRAIPYEPEAKY